MANCWYSGGSVFTAPSNSDLWMLIPFAVMMTGSASAGAGAAGGDADLVEEVSRERLRVVDPFPAEELPYLGEEIERAVRIGAAEAVDGVEGRDEPGAPLAIRVVHPPRVVVGTVQSRQRRRLRDR